MERISWEALARPRTTMDHRPPEPHATAEAGWSLAPPSRAARIANGFLAAYLAASLAWIVGSDEMLARLESLTTIPVWIHSVKGIAYVVLFGLALRRAARVHVESVERAHQAHIEAKLELVRRLALAAEYRDDETGGHNARIGRFAAVVAREMGLDEASCESLAYAASLHDLGKIGIPDHLLLKNGPLTPDERREMERHTTLGAEILEGGRHPLVRVAHAVALTHHERWDGAGYPSGLRGAQTPLEGRIVAVCDVFDALTNERPYKEAWPVADAVREIVREGGSHFDPEVVEAFLRALPEIERIRREVAPTRAAGYRAEPRLAA